MEKIRIGNDIELRWKVYTAQDENTLIPYDLTGRELKASLRCDFGETPVDFRTEENELIAIFRGKDQKALGQYYIILRENDGKDAMKTVDTQEAFELVPRTMDESHSEDGVVRCFHLTFESVVGSWSGTIDPILNHDAEVAEAQRKKNEEGRVAAEAARQKASSEAVATANVAAENAQQKADEANGAAVSANSAAEAADTAAGRANEAADKFSSAVVQQQGTATDKVMSQKAVTDALTASDQKLSELEDVIKSKIESNKFVIADGDGNVLAIFDKDGLHTTDIHVLRDNTLVNILTLLSNFVEKQSGKGLSSNDYTDAEKSDVAKIVDIEKIVSAIKGSFVNDKEDEFVVCDGLGNVIFRIDANGEHSVNEGGGSVQDNSLKGKKIVGVGDSLSASGYYEKDLAEISGGLYGGVFSEGGTFSIPDGSKSTQDRVLKMCQENTDADVVILENVNDRWYTYDIVSGKYAKKGTIEDDPFMLSQYYIHTETSATRDLAKSLFTNNFANIVSAVADKKKGTIVRMPYRTESIVMTIGSGATSNGTIEVVVGGASKVVAVTSGMTAQQVASAINQYEFDGYAHSVSSNVVTLTLLSGSLGTVQFSANGTGVTLTSTTSSSEGFVNEYFLGYSSSEFTNASKWSNEIPSLYSLYKGIVEHIQTHKPTVRIVWFCPTVWLINYNSPDASQINSDGSWNMTKIMNSSWQTYYFLMNKFLREIQREVCQYYGIECYDAMIDGGITPFNMRTYYNAGDVHPKRITYTKWAEYLFNRLK